MTDAAQAAAPAVPEVKEVPAWRLLATLGVGGAIAGLLLVVVYQATLPAIEAYKAKKLREAIHEVLKGPARHETLYLVGGKLTAELPDGADPKQLERIYLGFDANKRPVGFAIAAGEAGFQDVIELIFGYDPASRKLLGMKVLESKETPGLGSKIESDAHFIGQFDGVVGPVKGVKKGRGTGADNEVDMITGATISSSAVIRIINDALKTWTPYIEAYRARSDG